MRKEIRFVPVVNFVGVCCALFLLAQGASDVWAQDKDVKASQTATVPTTASASATQAAPSGDEMGQLAKNPVELNGDTMEYKADEGKFIASGHVVLKQGDSVLTCERAEFFREKGEAHVYDHVVLKSSKGTVWADKAFYNFSKKQGEFTHARIMSHPLFGYAETISKINENYYVMSDGYITTSDYDNPEWRVRAKRIEVFPGEKAVAHQAAMFMGGIPVAYWSTYTHSLRGDRSRIKLIPGYKKHFGAFLLASYRAEVNEYLDLTYHADLRELKGVAWGLDADYRTPKTGQGLVRTYYIDEHSISSRKADALALERYRIEWRHKWNIDPETSVIAQYNKLSDTDFLKTYFEREYRQDQNPLTFFLLTRNMPGASLTFRTDIRANDFDSPVERLPEINYSLNNQQIGDIGFYFKSSNAASNLQQKQPDPNKSKNSTVRLDTDNEISRPFKAGIFELRPWMGTEQTYYTHTLDSAKDDSVRGLFKTGMDASTKFYKVYDVNFKKWGIEVNQLRHIVTPTIAYQYQSMPTMGPDKFYQFDQLDARNRINKFALGIENRLQTKRDGKSVDLFRSLVTTDYRMEGNNSQGSFGDVTWENEAHPNKYVTFREDATYDNDKNHLRDFNFDVYMKDLKRWEWDLSRRWTQKDDDIVTSQVTYKFNPKWRTVIYHRFNADNGQWQEQQYSFIRDLHTWEVEFAYKTNNLDYDKGSQFWFIFRLKAFPRVQFNGSSSLNRSAPGPQVVY